MKNTDITKTNKRIIGLDLVRFIAVFFVVSVHFMLYSHFYEAKMEGIGMFIMTGLRWLFYTCVPLFIILTGYLKSKKKPNKEHYKSIVPILSTYLILSIIAILVKKFLLHTGDSYGHLIMGIFNFSTIDYAWYVNMYIGLFLLIPFLNILYQNIDTQRKKQILIGTLLGLVSLAPFINAFNIEGIQLNLVPNWWVGIYPFLYYFIGCYIKEYQIRLPKVANFLLLVMALFIETIITFFYSHGKVFDSLLFEGYNALPTVLIATLIFLLFYNVQFKNRPLRIMITDFSKLSFDIYLISCLVDAYFYSHFAKYVSSSPKALPYLFLFVPVIFLTSYVIAFIKRCIINGLSALKNSLNE